jgi:putative transcriptional regulator
VEADKFYLIEEGTDRLNMQRFARPAWTIPLGSHPLRGSDERIPTEGRTAYFPSNSLRIHNELGYKGIMSLHNRIAVLRAEKKLSRAALALSVGVNPQTIGFLERGDYTPSLELAFKIAEHFGLPVEAVFSPRPFRTLSEQVYELHKREA